MIRATWDETWLRVADAMAARSKCTNRQVGAVIVDASNRPISMGYNGEPSGYKHASWPSCAAFCQRSVKNGSERSDSYSNCVSVHAEANALLFADRSHYQGSTMYVTNPCCWDCAKLVANSGVARIVFRLSDADAHADTGTPIEFLKSCGLQVDIVSKEKI